MVQPYLLAALAAIAGAASAQSMKFVNPPPERSETNVANFPKFQQGSTVTVRWTKGPADKAMSLTLWQLDQQTMKFFGDMEYLSQNFLDKDSYSWLVATRKDLKKSNLFYFSIFQEGQSQSDSNSQYFNITTAAVDAPKPTTSTKTPGPSSATSTGATTPTSDASGAATSDTISGEGDAGASQDSGLSAGTKIAIGVAVPLAVLVALGAIAWLWFKRRRDRRSDIAAGQPMLEGGIPNNNNNNNNLGALGASPSAMTATTAIGTMGSPSQHWVPPTATTPGYWTGVASAGGDEAGKYLMGGYYQPPPAEMGPGSPQRTEMSATEEVRRDVYEMPTPETNRATPR